MRRRTLMKKAAPSGFDALRISISSSDAELTTRTEWRFQSLVYAVALFSGAWSDDDNNDDDA